MRVEAGCGYSKSPGEAEQVVEVRAGWMFDGGRRGEQQVRPVRSRELETEVRVRSWQRSGTESQKYSFQSQGLYHTGLGNELAPAGEESRSFIPLG